MGFGWQESLCFSEMLQFGAKVDLFGDIGGKPVKEGGKPQFILILEAEWKNTDREDKGNWNQIWTRLVFLINIIVLSSVGGLPILDDPFEEKIPGTSFGPFSLGKF